MGDPAQAHIFVDETKAKGYVAAAATLVLGDLSAPRKQLNALILPRQRSLHMKDESDPRRREIIDIIVRMSSSVGLQSVIYDAGRERSQLDRRAACLQGLRSGRDAPREGQDRAGARRVLAQLGPPATHRVRAGLRPRGSAHV